MPRPTQRLLCALLIAAASTTASVAPAEETLRWKFEPGQELRYQVVQQTDTNMDAGPAGQITTGTTQTIDMVWKVEAVNDDGSARMRHEIERVQMSMTAPMNQGFAFDTASAEPPEGLATLLAPAFNALVESGYKVTVSPTGELSDIEASEELVQAIKNLPGAGGAGQGEDALKAMASPVAVPLPAEAVEPGAEWTRSTGELAVPMFGKMQVETTFTYKGPRKMSGKPMQVLAPSININATAPEGGPMSGSVKSRDTSGEVLFDPAAGRVEEASTRHTMDISITAGQNTISGTITQTAKIKYGEQSAEPEAGSAELESEEPVGAP